MYKNIIFDVGEVLFTYNWAWCLEEAGLTKEEALKLGPELFKMKHWADFDLGIRPYWDVVDDVCKEIPEYSENLRIFLTNIDKMPLDRPRVWELVRKLKEKGYKLYLLSNYSKVMFESHTAGKPFMDDIDGMMVSYMVHINKPEEGIYTALMDKYNLNPKESLFFDDREDNTEAARKLGIDAITVTGEEMLLEELKKLLR